MTDINSHLRASDRLGAIYKQLGLALWRFQELEGVVARYYVLVALASRGMGITQGLALERTIKGKTFGRTVSLLRDAKKIPSELIERLPAIVKERNWLIHSSLNTSRSAVYDDSHCNEFLKRMETMTAEAGTVIKLIGKSAEAYVLQAGVSPQEIDRLTKQTLESWRDDAV